MKKYTMVIVGVLLFLAGYTYMRWQAEYVTSQNNIPNRIKTPVFIPSKSSSIPEVAIDERSIFSF